MQIFFIHSFKLSRIGMTTSATVDYKDIQKTDDQIKVYYPENSERFQNFLAAWQ